MRILVTEDDDRLRELIVRSLTGEGHSVEWTGDGDEAAWMLTELPYDVVVLDWMLPGRSGVILCRKLRERENWTPILMLTARDAVGDRVEGLDAGADDYLVKPFSLEELSARLRALTRRGHVPRPTQLCVGEIVLDPPTRTVTVGNEEIKLTPREFSLLEFFLRRKGEVLTRAEMIENVWDYAYEGDSNVVDVSSSVLVRLMPKAKKHDVVLSFSGDDAEVVAPPSLAERAIENLVLNAIAFAPPLHGLGVPVEERNGQRRGSGRHGTRHPGQGSLCDLRAFRAPVREPRSAPGRRRSRAADRSRHHDDSRRVRELGVGGARRHKVSSLVPSCRGRRSATERVRRRRRSARAASTWLGRQCHGSATLSGESQIAASHRPRDPQSPSRP